jgi:hypothetical protein
VKRILFEIPEKAYRNMPFTSPSSRNFLFTFLIAFLFLSLTGRAQSSALSKGAFQSGEKIKFTVFYSVVGMYVNAGTATLSTNQEKYGNTNAYHVVAEGITNKKYDWIFKVRDKYESYFEKETFKSLKFKRKVHEGDIKYEDEVIFSHANNNSTAITKNKTYKVPSSVLDVINAIFYARNIDYDAFKEGDKIGFNMFLDDKIYNMYIRYLGREKIQTRYGTFNAIKLRPLLLKGSIFEGGEKMTLWVTDDANHIPVRVESRIAVGSIKVDMMDYANLRHPLSSLIAQN